FAYRAAISPNGRYVTFQNAAYGGLGYNNGTNVTGNSGIYLRDRQTNTTQALPKPALSAASYDNCHASDVSDIGTVLMACQVPGPTDRQVFLHVPGAGGTPFLISDNSGGVRGNGNSGLSLAMDAAGLSMAFE